MNDIKQKMVDELAKQLYKVVQEIISENAGDFDCGDERAPKWVGRVFGASKDLMDAGKAEMCADIILNLIEQTASAPVDLRLCVVSTAMDLFTDHRPLAGIFPFARDSNEPET